jgi:hypothetical protein
MRRLKLTDEGFHRFKIGDSLPTDPLAKTLGLGKNLFPNSGTPGLGGGGNAGAGIDSLPVPLPAKPITSANPEVIQAEQDYAKASLLKKSVKKTIFAGDDGGYGGKQKLGM